MPGWLIDWDRAHQGYSASCIFNAPWTSVLALMHYFHGMSWGTKTNTLQEQFQLCFLSTCQYFIGQINQCQPYCQEAGKKTVPLLSHKTAKRIYLKHIKINSSITLLLYIRLWRVLVIIVLYWTSHFIGFNEVKSPTFNLFTQCYWQVKGYR